MLKSIVLWVLVIASLLAVIAAHMRIGGLHDDSFCALIDLDDCASRFVALHSHGMPGSVAN
jgi:hypothetical protein